MDEKRCPTLDLAYGDSAASVTFVAGLCLAARDHAAAGFPADRRAAVLSGLCTALGLGLAACRALQVHDLVV